LKDNLYTIGFAGGFSMICALLLTAAATVTAPYRENNARIEEVLNILTALNVPVQEGDSAARLLDQFQQNVREETRGAIRLYVYAAPEAPQQPKALAVRFTGPGLWGPIQGFLAVEPDGKKIRALTFSHQEETPGLGGEIAAPWFRAQFVGKEFAREGKPIRIRPPGAELGANEVHAITGATMTCDKLEAIINGILTEFIEETNGQL
jgi:Na+-transporting NADH:ubiquinone oxidoreductase subunit C